LSVVKSSTAPCYRYLACDGNAWQGESPCERTQWTQFDGRQFVGRAQRLSGDRTTSRRRGPGTGRVSAPLSDQRRRADDAIPQHGARITRHRELDDRPPHWRLSLGYGRSVPL